MVAIQLLYTSELNSTDVSLDLGPWVLVTQVVQCVTIVTSCIPYLLQLVESLPSGMFLSDELRRRELRDTEHAGEGRKWSAGVVTAEKLSRKTNNGERLGLPKVLRREDQAHGTLNSLSGDEDSSSSRGGTTSANSQTTIWKTIRISTRSDNNIEHTSGIAGPSVV